ncbi:hypothetical protein ACIRBZ_42140 [Streptomyces sp. NPDC094038]|uniref:hypothetical protein n=1 Tax=Streptomyces sp. NPDC094038 TaxID=3366055 RepID=UPI00380C2FF7
MRFSDGTAFDAVAVCCNCDRWMPRGSRWGRSGPGRRPRRAPAGPAGSGTVPPARR